MRCSTRISTKKEHSKNAMGENMANNKKGQNFSTWILAVGLTVIAANSLRTFDETIAL
jgi:hypothetical protein